MSDLSHVVDKMQKDVLRQHDFCMRYAREALRIRDQLDREDIPENDNRRVFPIEAEGFYIAQELRIYLFCGLRLSVPQPHG